jgi:hypothetical protein
MPQFFRIVETDNFGGDYPDEKFVNLPVTTEAKAQVVAKAINSIFGGDDAPRYWKVVPTDYKLQPGFEP